MSKGLNIHDGTGIIARDPGLGVLLAYGSNVPGAISGYAPGCKFIKTNGNSIGTVEFINIGTRASANFVRVGLGGAVLVPFVYGDATPIDASFVTVDRAYIVQSVIGRVLVAGTDPSAVTARVMKAASGVAMGSGLAVHTANINLKGSVDTNQVMTLAPLASTILLASGDSLGLDITGTATAARGVVSVLLLPA